MFDVNKAIYACDDVICRNIESFTLSKLWGIFTYFLRFANNMQNIVF